VQVFEFADRHRGAYSNSLRRAVCPFYCDVNGYQVLYFESNITEQYPPLCDGTIQ